MRTNRAYVRFGGIASALSVLLLLSACEPDASDPVSVDVDPASLHKDKPHGKPGDDNGEPPTVFLEGIVRVDVGGPLDGVVNSLVTPLGVDGGLRAGFMALLPVGTLIGRSTNLVVRYLQDSPEVTNGDLCFPFENGYVGGSLSVTEDDDKSPKAIFNFTGWEQDGATSTRYTLTLEGAEGDTWFPDWPVPAPSAGSAASKSAFIAATWTLTNSGKGKKKQEKGCSGEGDLPSGVNQVRVEVRNIGPTTLNPGTAAFLSSPFIAGVDQSNILRFDHTGSGDGECLDFRGLDCTGFNGGVYYRWSLLEDTPIYASADGKVAWAGPGALFYCSLSEKIVFGRDFVVIAHETDADDDKTQGFATVYSRLKSIELLQVGDTVFRGDLIGNAGKNLDDCLTESVLGFSVRAAAGGESLDYIDRFRAKVDPYGWLGPGLDPSDDVLFNRAENQELWLDTEAFPAPLVP